MDAYLDSVADITSRALTAFANQMLGIMNIKPIMRDGQQYYVAYIHSVWHRYISIPARFAGADRRRIKRELRKAYDVMARQIRAPSSANPRAS